jgi:hypothetical protein
MNKTRNYAFLTNMCGMFAKKTVSSTFTSSCSGCRQFRPMKPQVFVHVGIRIPNIFAVVVDNYSKMKWVL